MKLKVYFEASIAGKSKYIQYYDLIQHYLAKLNTIVIESISEVSSDEVVRRTLRESQLAYREVLKNIRDSDVFICDMTFGSPGVAMVVQDAVYRYKKPSLVLYHESKVGKLAAPFVGNPSRLLYTSKYNERTLEDILHKFLNKSIQKIPSGRFTVRMTEETDQYIEYLRVLWRESSKNRVVNRIIEKEMCENIDYKDFLRARLSEL